MNKFINENELVEASDKLEKKIQYAAKLELLIMLQEESNKQFNTDIRRFVNKFVEENK